MKNKLIKICFVIFVLFFHCRYEIILNKRYQAFDTVISTVSTKVKGLGHYDLNVYKSINSSINIEDFQIFDTADIVIPQVNIIRCI